MRYSFIQEPVQHSLGDGVKVFLLVGGIVFFLVILGAAVLYLTNKDLRRDLDTQTTRQATMRTQMKQIEQLRSQYEDDKRQSETLRTSNAMLAEQIGDLLALIPDDTVLSKFETNGTALVYAGTTYDFETLQQNLINAFAGQYVLIEIAAASDENLTMFRLRFATHGVKR